MRDFKYYSNIFYSNGDLDPWKAGGVTVEPNENLPMYNIKGAAHHLDLRLPNEEGDKGTDVQKARDMEAQWIDKWVRAYQGSPAMKESPVPVVEQTPAFLQ